MRYLNQEERHPMFKKLLFKDLTLLSFVAYQVWFFRTKINTCNIHGARDRVRTGMVLLPADFESAASANFATRAISDIYSTS